MIYKDEDVFEAARELKLQGEEPVIHLDKSHDYGQYDKFKEEFEFTSEPEGQLDLERPHFRLDLTPTRISHAVNFRILIDAMNQSGDLGELIQKELQAEFPQFTPAFLKNPQNWGSLDALDHTWQTVKNLKEDQNPRMLSDLIKHNIIDKSFFDAQDYLILFTPVTILFEAAAGLNRNSDENYVMQHISTKQVKTTRDGIKEYESYFIGTYFANFLYDRSVRFTNEMYGNGLLKGLPARKSLYFADVDYKASVMKLEDVISDPNDYGYLNLKFERTDSHDGTFLIDGKPVGHRVVLVKKSFKQEMSLPGRLINKAHRPQENPEVYDAFDPRELFEFSEEELEEGLRTRRLAVVDQFDEDVLEGKAYRHKLEGSYYAFKKGEIFSAPYTSYKVKYTSEKREIDIIRDKNIFNIAKQDITLFEKLAAANKGIRTSKKRRDILLAHLVEKYLFEKDKDRYIIEQQKEIIERQTAELQKLAEFDELTKIYNRRGFLNRMEHLYASDVRNENISAVVLGDIDNFKLYNDHYGHIKGDACLKHFADVLKMYGHRGSDIVGRYGGEEFILFLASTGPTGAESVVSNIIKHLHDHPYEHAKNNGGILTCSFGIVYSSQVPDVGMEQLISRADDALYKAKETGRDKYYIYDPETCIAKKH